MKNKRATVIVGSGFGDEGKGLMTDFFAAGYGADCVVARFNGGAQAGHTVCLPDGRRHVHSHFASGTLVGAATFLSRFFVSNPLLFFRERAELEKLKIPRPRVFADERGFVTTPYDMLLNQFAETARGAGKHGSCGIGFGETIERNLHEKYQIRLADLADSRRLAETLDEIRQNWIPARLEKLGVTTLAPEQRELLAAENLREDFLQGARRFLDEIEFARPQILTESAGAVLEGAQGLLLDQDGGWFPHVTRSNTGLQNAVELAEEAGIDALEVVYVTRAYATRHGAGHLPHELAAQPYAKIEDLTNVPNPHQDSLRFGWLDLDLLNRTIAADFEKYAKNGDIKFTRRLAVTCLDQIDEKAFFVADEKLSEAEIDEFPSVIAEATGFSEIYVSRSETREKIELFTDL